VEKGNDSTFNTNFDEENGIIEVGANKDENSSEWDDEIDSNSYWSYYHSYNFREEPKKDLTWEDGDKREAEFKYNENPTFGYWEDYYNDLETNFYEGYIEYYPFGFNEVEEEFLQDLSFQQMQNECQKKKSRGELIEDAYIEMQKLAGTITIFEGAKIIVDKFSACFTKQEKNDLLQKVVNVLLELKSL
jgi:hypothetical protein